MGLNTAVVTYQFCSAYFSNAWPNGYVIHSIRYLYSLVIICLGCVVVITTVQLHSTKPKTRFCTGSNPACSVSEICNGKDLWQWCRLKIRRNTFRQSTIPQKQFIVIINAILLTISVKTLRASLLNLCCDLSIVLLFSRHFL